jgi:ribose transport system substrate-binding protein
MRVYGGRGISRTLALATGMVLVVAACGNGDEGRAQPGDRDLLFSFANITEQGPLFVQLREGVETAAERAGIQVRLYDNNFDAETALRNARLMVQDNPDLIAEYTPVQGIADSLFALFEEAGIPCIAVNQPIPGCHWFNLINKDIGIDTAEVVGEIANSRGWDGTNTTVILVQASEAGLEVNDCIRYFYVTLQEMLPNMDKTTPEDIVPTTTTIGETGVQVEGEATLEGSFEAVKNILQAIPEDRNLIVYTINDDSALGALRAVEEAGRDDKTLIAGLGGSKQGLQQLRENPIWVAEGDLFFQFWGQYIMAMGVAILDGVEPPDVTSVPQIVLTEDTISEFYNEGEFLAHTLPPLEPIMTGPEGCPPRESAETCGNDYLAETGVLQLFDNVEGLE